QAPASNDTPAGSGTAWSEGSTTYSAAVPSARPHAAFQTHTRSPTREAGTPAPTASMTPAPSLCGTTRGNGIAALRRPARDLTSDGLTPEACTRTRTSPGPGAGVGSSPTRRTSAAAPVDSYQAARMPCTVAAGAASVALGADEAGRQV